MPRAVPWLPGRSGRPCGDSGSPGEGQNRRAAGGHVLRPPRTSSGARTSSGQAPTSAVAGGVPAEGAECQAAAEIAKQPPRTSIWARTPSAQPTTSPAAGEGPSERAARETCSPRRGKEAAGPATSSARHPTGGVAQMAAAHRARRKRPRDVADGPSPPVPPSSPPPPSHLLEAAVRRRILLWQGARQGAGELRARRERPAQGAGVTGWPAPPTTPPPLHLLEAAGRRECLVTLVRRQREENASVSLRTTAIWHLLLALGYGPSSPLGPHSRGPSPTTSQQPLLQPASSASSATGSGPGNASPSPSAASATQVHPGTTEGAAGSAPGGVHLQTYRQKQQKLVAAHQRRQLPAQRTHPATAHQAQTG